MSLNINTIKAMQLAHSKNNSLYGDMHMIPEISKDSELEDY